MTEESQDENPTIHESATAENVSLKSANKEPNRFLQAHFRQALSVTKGFFELVGKHPLATGLLAVIGFAGFFLSIVGYAVERNEARASTDALKKTESEIIQTIEQTSAAGMSVETLHPDRQFFVGRWERRSFELGQETHVIWTINDDGTTSYKVRIDGGPGHTPRSNWVYAEGLFYEEFLPDPYDELGNYYPVYETGSKGRALVRKIDENAFELTIVDNDNINYRGLKRVYRRLPD